MRRSQDQLWWTVDSDTDGVNNHPRVNTTVSDEVESTFYRLSFVCRFNFAWGHSFWYSLIYVHLIFRTHYVLNTRNFVVVDGQIPGWRVPKHGIFSVATNKLWRTRPSARVLFQTCCRKLHDLLGFGQLWSWATWLSLCLTALTIQGWLCCELSLITSLVSPRKSMHICTIIRFGKKKVKHATIQPSFHCHEVCIARQVVQNFAQSLNSYSNFGFKRFLLFVTHRRTSDVVFQTRLLQGPPRFVCEL